MTKFGYIFLWKIFTVFALFLVYFHAFKLSKQVTYWQNGNRQPSDNITIVIKICYNLKFNRNTCRPSVDNLKILKEQFTCEFVRPINCYTKEFEQLTPKQIINKFKDCDLKNFVNVENESNSTIKIEETEYELFMGHICVLHKFKVESENELTKIKIYPKIENKQSFNIVIYTTRAYQNQEIHSSIKLHLLERFCWMKSESNETQNTYRCTEDNKEILLEMIYFSLKSLESPMDSNCVYRDGFTQQQCYERCIKRSKKYYLLTYNETDDFILDYDKNSTLNLMHECTEYCNQPDCITGTFQIPTLLESDSTSDNFIVLQINNVDYPTEAISLVDNSKIYFLIIHCTCLFLGLDLFGIIIKATNLYNVPIKKSNKHKKITKKGVLFVFVLAIGLLVSITLEKKIFNLGEQNKMIFSKLDSIKERNLSVSICYDLCYILKKDNNLITKNECNNERLRDLTLNQLNEITYDSADFKKNSSMRNTVRITPIRQADFIIKQFFREFKKCFLIFYDARNLYPPISLQRKSQLHFNSSTADGSFTYFYIEDGFEVYPQINTPKNRTSFLHNIHIIDYNNRNCTNYHDHHGCRSRDECIQKCALKNYFREYHSISIYANLKMEDLTEFGNFKFEDNRQLFNSIVKDCELEYHDTECFSVKTTLRTKYVLTYPHDISVTLTPKVFYHHRAKDESLIVVINRVISFLIIFTGFSVKDIVKNFINAYCYTLSSIYNFQFVTRIAYLIVFLFFSIHFSFLFHSLIYHPMDEISYRYVLKEVLLPKVRICYELGEIHQNKLKKKNLDEMSLNASEIIESISIINKDFEKQKFLIDEVIENKQLFETYDFYLDSFKCFNFDFHIRYKVLNTNIFEAKELVTFVLNLKKLKHNKRVFVYLNSENSLDLEWYLPFYSKYFNILYVIEDFYFQDDFWYLKNFKFYIKSLFNMAVVKNTHRLYYKFLRDSFTREQYVTTTMVPLDKDSPNDVTIKNQQFNSYIHFRSLSGNKNDYDFAINSRKYTFMSDFTSEETYYGDDYLIISLRSVGLKFKMSSTNKYKLAEFCLYLFVLAAFWFKVDIIDLPNHLKQAFPVLKFFVICFIYCIVVFLLFLFESYFRLIRFLDFKYA